MQEFEQQGEHVMTTTKGRRPIEAPTVTGWAHDAVGDATSGFQLKSIRSGVETLLAANGISREIRGHLQLHGLTGVQARHYDGTTTCRRSATRWKLFMRRLTRLSTAGLPDDWVTSRTYGQCAHKA